MKIKFYFSVLILLFFLHTKIRAQDITFAGPNGISSVASGTILSLTAVGQSTQKYIGSVPIFGYSNYFNNTIDQDVSCTLYETDYSNGIFKYRFVNNGTVAKTINFLFVDVLIVTVTNGVYSNYRTNIGFQLTVQPSVIPQLPVYLVSHEGGSGYYNDIFQLQTSSAIPQGWYSSGIDFKAYTSSSSVETFGSVPIYQHKYDVFDINEGQFGDPKEIFFYSTSQSLTPIPLTGYSYNLISTSIAFYAFSTQVTGTIPVYRCSHKSAPIQFYKSADADIDPYAYDTLIEFYAYHPIDQ